MAPSGTARAVATGVGSLIAAAVVLGVVGAAGWIPAHLANLIAFLVVAIGFAGPQWHLERSDHEVAPLLRVVAIPAVVLFFAITYTADATIAETLVIWAVAAAICCGSIASERRDVVPKPVVHAVVALLFVPPALTAVVVQGGWPGTYVPAVTLSWILAGVVSVVAVAVLTRGRVSSTPTPPSAELAGVRLGAGVLALGATYPWLTLNPATEFTPGVWIGASQLGLTTVHATGVLGIAAVVGLGTLTDLGALSTRWSRCSGAVLAIALAIAFVLDSRAGLSGAFLPGRGVYLTILGGLVLLSVQLPALRAGIGALRRRRADAAADG